MQRDVSIDIAKGIAIILVIVGHCSLFPYHSFVYSFHMPLFFFIGGYLYKRKPVLKGMKSDFRRLILPYVVISLIGCLKFTITKSLQSDYAAVGRVWLGALYANGGTPHSSLFLSDIPPGSCLWFLPALFVCRNVFNIIANYIDSCRKQYVVGGVISVVATALDSYLINLPWGLLTGCSAVMFYMIGKYVRENKVPSLIVLLCVVLWGVCINFSHIDMDCCHYGVYPLDVFGACGGICVICSLSKFIERNASVIASGLAWMGRLSLVVLCMHYITCLIDLNSRLHTNHVVMYLFLDFILILPLTYLCSSIPITRKLFGV